MSKEDAKKGGAATRTLKLRILRGSPGRKKRFQSYAVTVPEEANLIDAVQQLFATQDSTLLFRRACHRASCGLCGARVNGRERLMCITPVSEFAEGSEVTLEPLRNLPWIGDLVVDVQPMMARLAEVEAECVCRDELACSDGEEGTRLADCLECGLCVSACPIAGSDQHFLGPAVLEAIARVLRSPDGRDVTRLCAMAGDTHGVWRCHLAMECSEVCPSSGNPSAAIGWLRRLLMRRRHG